MATQSPVSTHFVSQTLQSNFALWNALLTINGIMISAFGIAVAAVPGVRSFYSILLVGLCGLSILLLVLNFFAVKQLYLTIGRKLQDPNSADLTPQARQNDIRIQNRRHRWVQCRENVVLVLLVAEAVLIGVVLWSSGGF